MSRLNNYLTEKELNENSASYRFPIPNIGEKVKYRQFPSELSGKIGEVIGINRRGGFLTIKLENGKTITSVPPYDLVI